jgi:hypothetical protein
MPHPPNNESRPFTLPTCQNPKLHMNIFLMELPLARGNEPSASGGAFSSRVLCMLPATGVDEDAG